MSEAFKLNPDSPILQQLEGQWDKITAILLHKLKGTEEVVITLDDMMNYPRERYMLVYGHIDAIQLKLVTLEEAKVIIEHDAKMKGKA